MKIVTLSTILVCLCEANAVKLPVPQVYVVTPSSRQLQIDEGRSAPRPFYYHNWMRRMDPPINATTTTTTTPKAETPDLIFAEFESDSMKNIRKLLEKERIKPKTTTTMSTTSRPIYVTDEEASDESENVNYELPSPPARTEEPMSSTKDMTDYFALYNNLYNVESAPPVPVYTPSTTVSTTSTIIETTTRPIPANHVENIWHIIDNEKQNQYTGMWDEVPVSSEDDHKKDDDDVKMKNQGEAGKSEHGDEVNDDAGKIDENFALPGFSTNPGNDGENESRAIRTEPNIRFPYVSLKPFQMKNVKKPVSYSNSKKGNNMYTNLDNFFEVKNPVRGEVQDSVPMRQPVDRYNPAQPYLPATDYGKSKQSVPSSPPVKTIANLVPPPPPPPPKVTEDDFPSPASYESFPPYAPSRPVAPPSPPRPPIAMSQPPSDLGSPSYDSYSSPGDDSDSGPPMSMGSPMDMGPPMDMGYRYKAPSPPVQSFLPTLPPVQKPFGGYSYKKPAMTADVPPPMETDEKPDFQGYHYDKPAPAMPDTHDHHGYHYSKPEPPAPPKDHPPMGYGHPDHPSQDHPPPDNSDYPELIFDNHHDHMGGGSNGDGTKGNDNDMGMVPPPPPGDMKPDMDAPGPPMDDHGFPNDFPGDFKYHHDFDDHDFYHHHHHHTTTTTTTTEMPRVNRYSYYYLGKKLYYLPLYFSVYFIVYVGALIIKAVLRHKIVYPNSWRPNDQTASFFSKRSVDSWDLSNENLHEITGRVTHAIGKAAEKYMKSKESKEN